MAEKRDRHGLLHFGARTVIPFVAVALSTACFSVVPIRTLFQEESPDDAWQGVAGMGLSAAALVAVLLLLVPLQRWYCQTLRRRLSRRFALAIVVGVIVRQESKDILRLLGPNHEASSGRLPGMLTLVVDRSGIRFWRQNPVRDQEVVCIDWSRVSRVESAAIADGLHRFRGIVTGVTHDGIEEGFAAITYSLNRSDLLRLSDVIHTIRTRVDNQRLLEEQH